MAKYATSATQTSSTSVAAKFLFARSSAGGAPLSRRVVLFLLPRMQPCSPASLMSLATLFLEQRLPRDLNSACTLGEPWVSLLRRWISRILSVRAASFRLVLEGSLSIQW